MAAFEYQALNERGRTLKGIATGDHSRQVRQDLRARGLVPISVVPVAESGGRGDGRAERGKARRTRIKTGELSVVTRQLATLLGSGLTVEDTLAALAQQSEGHRLVSVISDIRSLVTEGYSLSEAVALYPKSFPEIYRASIYAGEQSGNLDEVLDRLADYLETRHGIQQRLGVALVYPIFLTAVAVTIVVALVTYVVPKVVKVFEDTGQELPLLTRGLIGLSEFMQDWGIWLLVLIGIAAFIFTLIFRQPGPRFWLHGQYLRLPGLKRLTRSINTARMARTLSIMVSSGVPLLVAMRSTQGVVTNDVLRADLKAAAVEVSEGVSISRALGRSGNYPPLLVQMVASGESSGRLGHMLEKAAGATESELESRINMMVGLFEPVMILVMGVVVLVIVLAILMPIFDLNQLIS
jgi:general secretion pathway protein F